MKRIIKMIIYIQFIIIIIIMNFSVMACKKPKPMFQSDYPKPISISKFKLGGKYYQSPNAVSAPAEFKDITASQIVSEMTIGWNLGNTLDAHPGSETSWGNPLTTEDHIKAIKNAGFNSIRIPVTWYRSVNAVFDIDSKWMDRVTEVVNYAIDNDMIVIINSHHDEHIFKFTVAERNASLTAFHKIWSQIAYNFRNYNEKLIFESLNEPRTKGSEREWQGGTSAEHLIVNEHYELFVRIVRASRGNNDKRILVLNTYAASAEQSAMNGLVIPKDKAKDKIIASIHSYAPYDFALNQGRGATNKWSIDNKNDTGVIIDLFDRAEKHFMEKGYPVIMGEFGAVFRNNEEARAAWAEYYVGYAKSKGIPCFVWDNGGFSGNGELFGLYDRRENSFPFPEYLDGLLRGAGVR